MGKLDFKGFNFCKESKRLNQGDVVFCEGSGSAEDFWGVVYDKLGVISFVGGSNNYVYGDELYLGEKYNYWTITKRIPCEKVKITVEEIE